MISAHNWVFTDLYGECTEEITLKNKSTSLGEF